MNIRNIIEGVIWILLAGLLMVLLASSTMYLEQKNVHDLDIQIELLDEGASLVGEENIWAMVSDFLKDTIGGANVSDLDVAGLESHLTRNTFVRGVKVYYAESGLLSISVDQRRPLFRVFKNNGDNFYVDDRGGYMSLCQDFVVRCLVVTGHVPPFGLRDTLTQRSVMSELYQIVHHIDQDQFLRSFIDEVYVTSDAQFLLTPKMGDFVIQIGTSADLELKFDNLQVFLSSVIGEGEWQKYEKLNIEYPNQVVATKRKVS